ncbi:UDP-N-acetylmuramoyl-L-alanyl-D-glutamate--2,6-diaminopimelate ligase [Tsukamurella pseudospumae]|uniref:UDP-N-acetylmuramoyl-L-alanyl-D-glutamate--2,6-diaminopimelate ligase n=1 Tax=Tsukamurella pseudospumae TaxID=239498 RepID=A0A138AVV7_9ACTN|nr:UDP-N-acetylmuramoyl-L-alanyl-D-glutamate--2,6-diaminopimelate ligase [Tsukamurella pseudospumae]KXP14575.1 UDP-N-acetylmuramoyl-L-alanyl-D-glutamate--2,6-diaminopimelate ligase [Tsukamurella pseudospumae]
MPESTLTRPAHPRGATPAEVAAQVAGVSAGGRDADGVRLTGATVRAQDARPGDLFCAVPGTATHGARFAAGAIEAGAVAVLTDPDGAALLAQDGIDVPVLLHDDPRTVLGPVAAVVYGAPSSRMTLVGITGTSGKTTTSFLVEAALAAGGHPTGLIGTVGTRIDGVDVPSSLTTPEGTALQGLFASMVERGVTAAVMEVSSHALAQNRAGGSRFAVGAFTNLSQDHLDYHPTMEDYFAAKSLLFIPGDAAPQTVCDRAVICVDDEWGVRMADLRRAAGLPLVTVATTGPADWTAGEVAAHADGTQRFTLSGPDGQSYSAVVGLPGAYNVANAALALVIAHEAGVPLADAIRGIGAVAVPGRVQRIDRGQDFLAVVDYAHKPAALDAVIATLRGQTAGRIVVVVGAGGDRDRGKRPLMGEAAARAAELVIVTDDNPRTEDPAAIRAAVLAGARAVPGGGEVREVGDRRAAIVEAVNWARTGDVVLIAGKGHEAGQEINGVKHPFDDRDEVAAALETRASGEHA